MTSEAPKEIYAWVYDQWKTAWNVDPEESDASASRYTLTTHALAMVAAEREACARLICDGKKDSEWFNPVQAIRTRTPDDAQAALDALLKAERVKALREAADCIGHITRAEDQDAILALIEKETGHE